MKILVSRNLSTQFEMHVSVFPSSLFPGLSTHFSQQISVNAWIWLWNLCFCSSTISSSWSFLSIWELLDDPPNDILAKLCDTKMADLTRAGRWVLIRDPLWRITLKFQGAGMAQCRDPKSNVSVCLQMTLLSTTLGNRLPTEPWSRSVESWSICWAHVFLWREWITERN